MLMCCSSDEVLHNVNVFSIMFSIMLMLIAVRFCKMSVCCSSGEVLQDVSVLLRFSIVLMCC